MNLVTTEIREAAIKQIRHVLADAGYHGVLFVGLFGSVVRPETKSCRDIDVYILVEHEELKHFYKNAIVRSCGKSGMPLDVMPISLSELKEGNPLFGILLRRSALIFEREPGLRECLCIDFDRFREIESRYYERLARWFSRLHPVARLFLNRGLVKLLRASESAKG